MYTVVFLVVGVICGSQAEGELFLMLLGFFCLTGLLQNWGRQILFFVFGSALIGFLIGLIGLFSHLAQFEILRKNTGDFTHNTTYTGKISHLVYKKERSKVFLMQIDNFDNFDKIDTNIDNGSTWRNIEILSLLSYKSTIERYIYRHIFDISSTLIDTFSTSVFVEVPENLTVNHGETLQVRGKIKSIIEFPLKGFEKYAFFHGGYGLISIVGFTTIKKSHQTLLSQIRSYWKTIFDHGFPQNIAGTLLGMTVGSVDLLTQSIKDAFIASGIAHILVVSGSNIAFLMIFLGFFLKYFHLKRWQHISIVLVSVLFYDGIVGYEVSVIRATIMGVFSYLMVEYGVKGSSKAFFGLALLILTIMNPLGCVYDAGFGLSFGATLGILLFQPQIQTFCQKYALPHIISSGIAVVVGSSLGSFPILLYHFGQIPVAGLFANIIIAPLLGWILCGSILFVIVSKIHAYLGFLFGYTIYLPTKFILSVAEFFENMWIISVDRNIAIALCLILLGWYTAKYLEE